MSCDDISFLIFPQVIYDKSFSIICVNPIASVLKTEWVFSKKLRKSRKTCLDKVPIFFSIEPIHISTFCKFCIPKGEFFLFGYSFFYLLEKCISLSQGSFIVSFYDVKLLIGAPENTIDIISSHTWCKIEEIHVKG